MLPVASSAFPISGFSDGSLLCWAWTFKAIDRGSQFFCCSTGKPDRSSLPLLLPIRGLQMAAFSLDPHAAERGSSGPLLFL